MTADGFIILPHTADLMFEAWGTTRARCFEQAARALVSTFASVAADGGTVRRLSIPAGENEGMLVAMLEEIVFLADARALAPAETRVGERPDGGLDVTFTLSPIRDDDRRGAPPKAITYHALAVTDGRDGWRCRVTVDV